MGWPQVNGDDTGWLRQRCGGLGFARQEQTQSALRPSLSLHGPPCNENHHLAFHTGYGRNRSQGGDSVRKTVRALHTPPASSCRPASRTWARAVTWAVSLVCCALLARLWTCLVTADSSGDCWTHLVTMDSSGDRWTLGWTRWLPPTASVRLSQVPLLRMLSAQRRRMRKRVDGDLEHGGSRHLQPTSVPQPLCTRVSFQCTQGV